MSLEGAFANGSVAHMPFRNVYGCYLDTIPARFDGCVASFCLETLVLRASFTGNHTNRDERASREKTIAKKQRGEREEISDLSCPGNLSLSLSLYIIYIFISTREIIFGHSTRYSRAQIFDERFPASCSRIDSSRFGWSSIIVREKIDGRWWWWWWW